MDLMTIFSAQALLSFCLMVCLVVGFIFGVGWGMEIGCRKCRKEKGRETLRGLREPEWPRR